MGHLMKDQPVRDGPAPDHHSRCARPGGVATLAAGFRAAAYPSSWCPVSASRTFARQSPQGACHEPTSKCAGRRRPRGGPADSTGNGTPRAAIAGLHRSRTVGAGRDARFREPAARGRRDPLRGGSGGPARHSTSHRSGWRTNTLSRSADPGGASGPARAAAARRIRGSNACVSHVQSTEVRDGAERCDVCPNTGPARRPSGHHPAQRAAAARPAPVFAGTAQDDLPGAERHGPGWPGLPNLAALAKLAK